MASSRSRKAGSYITGEKGVNRVRLFAHPRTKLLFLEYRAESRKKRIALGHADQAKGKEAADALAAALRTSSEPRNADLTLRGLFDMYEREVTPTKSAGKQAHDRRARALFERLWGAGAKVRDLDRRDWDRFILERRSGSLRPVGSRRQGKVGNRVIETDLRFLLAVCNWAESVRVSGQPLLARNPFRGFPVPVEASPRRPLVDDDEFSKLQLAAAKLGDPVPLFVLLAHETGHRGSAIAKLRWSDLDLNAGTARWRAENDKTQYEHVVPLSDAALEALRAAQRASPAIGEAWVFPSPADPQKPISRHLRRDWWKRLERLAGLRRVKGRGWHSLRRKFATELKNTPLPDLAALGGWRDSQTILKCYQHADQETMRGALAARQRLRAAGE